MVTLSRLDGRRFALNADLIERVDETPDTVVTLLSGTKYLVRESLDQVVDLVVGFRGTLLATASEIEASCPGPESTAPAAVVPLHAPMRAPMHAPMHGGRH